MPQEPVDGTMPLSGNRLPFDTPWKARNEMLRFLMSPLARGLFALSRIAWRDNWKIYGLPIIQRHRRSRISIGSHLSLRSTTRSNPLGPAHPVIMSTRGPGAHIVIGHHFAMTGGSIIAEESVEIGDRVTVGADCVITDTDFHPLDPIGRFEYPTAGDSRPVSIGDDVFLGMRSLVLKGVAIGSGTVVGAGSVVTQSLPERVIAAGNPARIIRPL